MNSFMLKSHNYQTSTKVIGLKSHKCRVCSDNIYFQCVECAQVNMMESERPCSDSVIVAFRCAVVTSGFSFEFNFLPLLALVQTDGAQEVLARIVH